jgi:uncharacterized protein
LVLFPGAGSSASHSSLLAVEAAAAAVAVTVERVDFPYRLAGRKAPDRAPVLLDAVEAAATAMAERVDRVVVGGRSMGGRMASMAVAAGRVPKAAGLVLIAYPLHPPGKPEKAAERSAHLPSITVPTLVLHGTKDPFATPAELRAAFAVVPAPMTWEWVDGARHDLKAADERIAATVVSLLAAISR